MDRRRARRRFAGRNHPDGLLEHGAYLDRLAERTGGAYTLVEKVFEGDEQLPPGGGPTGGAGYRFLRDVDRLLVDPAGQTTLDEIASSTRRTRQRLARTHHSERDVTDGILQSEMRRVATRRPTPRPTAGAPWPEAPLVDAISELAACFPVYRSYLPDGRSHLDAAFRRRARPAPRPGRDTRSARSRARRPDAPGGGALPTDVRDGHRQGARGSRLLPLESARHSPR